MTVTGPTIGQKYTIQPGDTISEIAFVAYGDARRYLELVAHNKDVPGFQPARLRPGLEIDVPEPDYLPLPGGVGGFRASAGRTFSLRPAPAPSGAAGSGMRSATADEDVEA
jgi:hypothetical protein